MRGQSNGEEKNGESIRRGRKARGIRPETTGVEPTEKG